MTKDEFQKNVLSEIKRELEKGDVPMDRMRELAAAALELGERYPSEIPTEEAMKLVGQYSDVTKETAADLKEARVEEDKGKIDEIRRSMGLR